jgi:hypothetical protein
VICISFGTDGPIHRNDKDAMGLPNAKARENWIFQCKCNCMVSDGKVHIIIQVDKHGCLMLFF